MEQNEASPFSVYEYIERQPQLFRDTLNQLRNIILSVAPGAEQMISYQVPSYCSLYVMSSSLSKTLKEELRGSRFAGTTLHFAPGELLPEYLIRKIVMARLQQNQLKYDRKKSRYPWDFMSYGIHSVSGRNKMCLNSEH